jgi:hypothetical protein
MRTDSADCRAGHWSKYGESRRLFVADQEREAKLSLCPFFDLQRQGCGQHFLPIDEYHLALTDRS